jgi:hypothetical protein
MRRIFINEEEGVMSELSVKAWNVRATETGASDGVDLDVEVTLPDGRVLDGEVTLRPAADGRPRYTSWGGSPDYWLDPQTWGVIRELSNYADVLDAIEAAAADAVIGAPAC